MARMLKLEYGISSILSILPSIYRVDREQVEGSEGDHDWSRVKRSGDLTTGMEVQVTYKRCHRKAKILSLYLFVVEITYKLHLSLSKQK